MNRNLCKTFIFAFETSRISKVTADVDWPGLQISCIRKSGRQGWKKSAEKQDCNQNLVVVCRRQTGRDTSCKYMMQGRKVVQLNSR